MTENSLQIATNYLDIVQAGKALTRCLNTDASLPEYTPWNNFGTKLATLLNQPTIISLDDDNLFFSYVEFSVCFTRKANDVPRKEFVGLRKYDKFDDDDEDLDDYKILMSIIKVK
jgi:hypothetical protein